MKALDRIIQRLRINKALSFIPPNSNILDIGCSDGVLFKLAGNKMRFGVGLDPCLTSIVENSKYKLIPGYFPNALSHVVERFDVITMLAVFEHIPPDVQSDVAYFIPKYLVPNGKLILTVPSILADRLLVFLNSIKLIDGMALGEHYGFNPDDVENIFSPVEGLILELNKKFEFGLNNLFVYRKT